MPNAGKYKTKGSAVAAAKAYKQAKKAEKTAKRAMAGPKKKANKSRTMGKPMGVLRSRTKQFIAPAARGYENRSTRIANRSTFITNDTAISVNVKGTTNTASGADMVFMATLNPGLAPDTAAFSTPGQASYINGVSLWSSQQARLYQKHSLRHRRCHVTVKYTPTCGSSQAGEVGITFFRNAAGAIPTFTSGSNVSRQQYVDQQPRVFGNVWNPHSVTFKPERDDKNDRQVRVGIPTIPNSDGAAMTGVATDLNVYDYGFFVVWLDGVASGISVGNIDISFCWELITPSVVNAGIAGAADAIIESDHYVMDASASPSTMITIPAAQSSTRFNWTTPTAAYVSQTSNTLFGCGVWHKATGSSLGTTMDSAGIIRFESPGLYSITWKMRMPFSSVFVPSTGDYGFVSQWTSGGSLQNYSPFTVVVGGGVSVISSAYSGTGSSGFGWNENLSGVVSGYDGFIYTEYFDVPNVTIGSVVLSGISANFLNISTSGTTNTIEPNGCVGDIWVTQLDPAATVRYRKWQKEQEKKDQRDVKEKVEEMWKYMSATFSPNGDSKSATEFLSDLKKRRNQFLAEHIDEKKKVGPLDKLIDEYVSVPSDVKEDRRVIAKRSSSVPKPAAGTVGK